jgi:hypothetical protein
VSTSTPDPVPASGPNDGDRAELATDLARIARDVAALARRVVATEDKVEDIASAFDEIEAVLTRPDLLVPHLLVADDPAVPGDDLSPAVAGPADGGAPSGPDNVDDEPGLDMRVLIEWVGDNVANLLERRIPQSSGFPRWCSWWWLHPEAITRFEALRRLWMVSVTDPAGGMVVYLSHLDQQLAVLGAEYGPFSGCSRNQHATVGSTARFLGQHLPDPALFDELDAATTGEWHDVTALPAAAS